MSAFAIQVVEIDESGRDYAFALTREWLDGSLADAGLRADPNEPPGSLDVHAQKNGAEFLITGRVRASLATDCGRCLAPARIPVDSSFATLFVRKRGAISTRPAPAALELSHEDVDDDELQREEFSGHEIALDDLVREYLVLEMPMQALCSADCQGIAVPEHLRPPADPFATADESVDPRLAPLLRLRDKVPPNKE